MYLKPPSSVEHSISFLFMAQNWSNLSVMRQTMKNLFVKPNASRFQKASQLNKKVIQIILGFSQILNVHTPQLVSYFLGLFANSHEVGTGVVCPSECSALSHWSTWIYWPAGYCCLFGCSGLQSGRKVGGRNHLRGAWTCVTHHRRGLNGECSVRLRGHPSSMCYFQALHLPLLSLSNVFSLLN